MDFSDFKIDDSGPVYLQVVRFFKRKILTGELQNGDELPSRRVLAATLGLNLTTIQKIYKQLEAEKYIDTMPNSKTLVCYSKKQIKDIENELIKERVIKFVEDVKSCNVSKEVLLGILEEVWNEEKGREEK